VSGAGNGPAVSVRALRRDFDEVCAIGGIDLHVADGELFGIVGPDGAGKTTTLRVLAGVLPVTSGEVEVLGHRIDIDPESAKAEVAYMPQRFGLYTDLTVAENLAFYADLFGVPGKQRPARLERLYRFSRLEPFRDRLAGDLSGGMKQKLGLSCALVHRPRLLLLDEPTFGVDPISRRELWLIVHEMVAEGVTALVSTAYMDEAERFDRLALLHEGTVRAYGAPDELRRKLENRILRVAGSEVRRLTGLVASLPYVEGSARFGDELHVRVGDARESLDALVDALKEAGQEATVGVVEDPSLEDVFIAEIEGEEAGRAA
jgi:drug efflux transport system ATP-binding protein